MQWVRLDSQAMSHPKLLRAGAEAVALWVSGLCHCNTHATNGRIDLDMVPLLYPPLGPQKAKRAAQQLCRVGLWHDHGGHFAVHDYEDFQAEAAKEVVEARREHERLKKRDQRAREQRPSNVPANVPSHVPDNVPDMSRTDGDECPGLSPRARTRGRAPASDRPTDRQTERGETPPSIGDQKSMQATSVLAEDIDDPWDAPAPLKPCWRLWRIWEETACSGPDTGGDRKPHERALTVTYGSLEKRAPADPEGLFRRMAEAYVAQRRGQGKRLDLKWFLDEFAGWAESVERGTSAMPHGHLSEPDLALRPELRPMPKVAKIPREVPQ